MYTIHVDGKLLHAPGLQDEAYIALNVKPSLDIESSGSLSFVLPPGNAQYDSIRMMKSIITMHQDDKMIFRGRVLEDERDFYNQKTVYCEGDLSFLLDSLWEEQTVTGNVQELFRQMIANHNAQVEPDKQFTVGIITAVDADEPYDAEMRIETRRYWDTSTIIDERLISVYGGYLRTRTEDGITYIDWLSEFGEESTQPIRFSVNLLDLKNKLDGKDVFTFLIPLGYSEIQDDGTYCDPVNICSVNGGLSYIVDEEAYAKYGKIWRSKTWGNTKDPAALKGKALEYIKTGGEVQTLTLKAVDMHFIDGSIDMLAIGKKVFIDSDPHGISLNMVLAKMEPDTENPDNSTYTFGVKPRTLSEAVIRTEKETDKLSGKGLGGGRKSIQEEAQDILRWAKISVDEANANINLNAGEIDKVAGRMSQAEIDIDGINAEILLKASQKTVDALGERLSQAEIEIDGANAQIALKANQTTVDALGTRMTNAEIEIDGANAEILLKASQTTVDDLGNRVSSAEIEIDGINSEIELKADKITLNGYVTANQLATEFSNFESGISDNLYVSALSASGFECSSFDFKGYGMSLDSATFLTSSTTLTVNSTGGTVTGVTLNKKTGTIYYMSWE